jgi:hypothetical protein
MNKAPIIAGIIVAAISKVIILKSVLIDAPAYEECISRHGFNLGASVPIWTCGPDPFIYFLIGWFITVGGFILIVFGLRMPATRSIPR